MIQVEHLTKEFSADGKIFRAVNDVSFQVNKGEVYGIIGLSGAGKSTLVRCLNRLEEPTEGKVVIDGVNITGLNERDLNAARKEMGMIFQNFNLFQQKSVYENIAYPLRLMKMGKREIDERVTELLAFIDLTDKRNAYPAEISGGQKQRVAIARALATRPKLLLSDEGTSALDPANAKQIIDLLRKTVDEYDMTIVMITHQMEVAKEICDRVAVMENGKIIEENTVEQLFRHPKQARTRSFIDALQENTETPVPDFEAFRGSVRRISYGRDTTDAPLLSRCAKQFDVDINIISGNINHLATGPVGCMYVEFTGAAEEIFKAEQYLKENGLIVEVV